MDIEQVPYQFMDPSVLNYPIHNRSDSIESYFFNYSKKNEIQSNLTYLPIQWTNYLVNNNYGNNIDELKSFISKLDYRNKKFFTITQYAGGPLVDIDNTVVFSSGGMFNTQKNKNLSYIYIPLITEKHKLLFKPKKKYKVGYIGRNTHPIREKLIQKFSDSEKYNLISLESTPTKRDSRRFKKLISESLFSLCPRGFGPSSFRLYESIDIGSIPIYISDQFLLPFQDKIDWEKLSIIITFDEIDKLDSKVKHILDNDLYKEMLSYGKYCNEKYFTKNFVSSYIQETVEKF